MDVRLADVDLDGRLDAIVAHTGDLLAPSVAVLQGRGDGGFEQPLVLPAPLGGRPVAVAVGELTGDALPDLVVAGWSGDDLAILPGLPVAAGQPPAFGTPSIHALPGTPAVASLRLADVDGDQRLDLVVLIESAPAGVAVLRGLGGGSFDVPRLSLTGGVSPAGLALGDIDGDGALDALLGHFVPPAPPTPSQPELLVMLGDGSGSFAPALHTFTGAAVSDVKLADLDEDGLLDVVVGHGLPGTLTWLANQGDGQFGPPQSLIYLGSQVEAADMDGDGHMDLAALFRPPYGWPGTYLVHGFGDGSFDLPTLLPDFAAWPAHAGDVDGDGDLDLVGRVGSLGVAVSLWEGAEGFGAPTFLDAIGSVSGLDLADLDLDGKLDVVATASGSVAVYAGLGDGSFAAPQMTAVGSTRQPIVADANGDGLPDVLVSLSTQGFAVLLGTGGGALGAPITTTFAPFAAIDRFAVGYLDGDDVLDVVAQADNGFRVLIGAGDGTFAEQFVDDPGSGGNTTLPLVLADFDGDGDTDLVRQTFQLQLQVWHNDGAGGFQLVQWFWSGFFELSVGDANGDGTLDVLGDAVLLGFGDGTFAPLQPAGGGYTVGDFDGDGHLDGFLAGLVYLNRSR